MTLQLKSVFKDLLWNYREILLSTGTKPVSIDRQIRFLDDFFIAEEVKDIVFDKELITKWYKFKPEQGELSKFIRISFSRRFLNYVRSLGYDVEIPRKPRNISSNQQCYIYNSEEILKYFAQFKKIVALSNLIQRIYRNDIRNRLP